MKNNNFDGDVSVGRNLATGGDANIQGSATIGHNLKVKGWLEADNIKDTCKGMFETVEKLRLAYPLPKDGWWALVGDSLPAKIYLAEAGEWNASGGTSGLPTLESQQLEEILENFPAMQENISNNKKVIDQTKESLSALQQQHTLDKSALDATIATEQAERSQTDLNLQKAIDAEVQSRTSEDTAIKQKLATEILNRQAGYNSLDGKITAETTARTDADTALGKRIDNLSTGMDNGDQELHEALRDEEHNRQSADTKLGERITTLENVGAGKVVKRLSANYVSNGNLINPENDLELISTLVDNKGAETTEKITIPSATNNNDGIMSKEKARFLSSLAGLQLFGASDGYSNEPVATNDTVTLNFPLMEVNYQGDYSQSDTGTDYVLKSATATTAGLMSSKDKAQLDSLPKDIADEVTARTEADKVLTDNLATEVRERNQAILLEADTRSGADVELSNKINAEQTAREQADKTLQTNIDALKATATAETNGLMSKEDKAKFDEMKAITPYAEDLQSYGVEIPKPNEGTSKVRRIGNMEMHRTLPIQSKMRGCLLDDDGKVVEYLPEDDWTTATRDGSKGQVMVEIPEHWERFYINEQGLQCVRISEINLPGYFFVPKMYVSAYEATIQRSTNKLCSVVNKDVDYRGGNNTAEYDGQYNSLLGMPVTMLSREKFREYARNRNANKTTEWNCYLYEAHRILFWLYIIEYADRNIQLDYNAQKTAEGFMQGGLGQPFSIAWGDWTTYNKTNPIVPCGYTDEFGNRSGAKQITIDNNAGITHTRWVPRYRGVENIFGHIFLFCDGVNIKVSPTIENGGDNTSKVYVCNDPSKFNGTNYDGYEYIGNETRVSTYITDILFGKRGHTINKEGISGGNTQIGYCDYAYTDTKNKMEELRVLLLGGHVSHGTSAGLACTNSHFPSTSASPSIGSRLCFSPSDAKHEHIKILSYGKY